MDQDTYNFLSATASVLTLLLTLIGLYAVYAQLRKIQEAAWSNINSKLCDQSFEFIKFLNEKPEIYDYFYMSKPLTSDESNRVTVLYTAEAFANFMEHLLLQKDNLPPKQWDVWARFIRTTFKLSVVVSGFVQEHREWYSDDLLEVADECKLLYHIPAR